MPRLLLTLIFAAASIDGRAQEAPVQTCAASASALGVQTFAMFLGSNDHRKPKMTEFVIDSRGTCLLAADGKTVPALLIRIEPTAQAINLKLTSVSGKDSTLPARVAILDGQFAETKAYSFDRFTKRGADYTTTLFLNPSDAVRYLLATPDADWIGRQSQTTQGRRWTAFWSTGLVMGTISNGTEERRSIPFAVFGTLRLELEDDNRLVGASR
jgi:hypothetical protein